MELVKNRSIERLMAVGAVVKTAFCGPCFGAGDTPANQALSIRHATRNFPNREGSKPSSGQLASVALMDARSIAATALHGGLLTPATEVEVPENRQKYSYDGRAYENRVYQGFGKARTGEDLKFGPNIADWPKMEARAEGILLEVASVIHDPVTTTDELIPSGETSSYRSNPYKLAEFTLSRKDPGYVGRAKAFQDTEKKRLALLAGTGLPEDFAELFKAAEGRPHETAEELKAFLAKTEFGTVVCAVKPGDGSAREQAASCQKVLGGQANVAVEYATKRYRSNLINWGMLPFTVEKADFEKFEVGSRLYVPGIRKALEETTETVPAWLVGKDGRTKIVLRLAGLASEDRAIILAGCLMNYYAKDLA